MGDLRLSVRHLLAAPGFSAAAITVLALGIGLNAAMFSIVYAFTLAGRGFPEPDRVVQLYARDARTNADYRPFSYPVYQDLLTQTDLFSGLLAHNPAVVGVGAGSESRRSLAAVVSADHVIHLQNVTVGRDYGNTIEVANGLEEGDAVVVNPTDVVREGAKVNPVPISEKPAAKGAGAR